MVTTISRIFSDVLYAWRNATRGWRTADEILMIREVAELLKINEKTAYQLASAGKIPGLRIGGSWRFKRQEIANLNKAQDGRATGAAGIMTNEAGVLPIFVVTDLRLISLTRA